MRQWSGLCYWPSNRHDPKSKKLNEAVGNAAVDAAVGKPKEKPVGSLDATPDGIPDATPEGAAEATPDGAADGAADGDEPELPPPAF